MFIEHRIPISNFSRSIKTIGRVEFPITDKEIFYKVLLETNSLYIGTIEHFYAYRNVGDKEFISSDLKEHFEIRTNLLCLNAYDYSEDSKACMLIKSLALSESLQLLMFAVQDGDIWNILSDEERKLIDDAKE